MFKQYVKKLLNTVLEVFFFKSDINKQISQFLFVSKLIAHSDFIFSTSKAWQCYWATIPNVHFLPLYKPSFVICLETDGIEIDRFFSLGFPLSLSVLKLAVSPS